MKYIKLFFIGLIIFLILCGAAMFVVLTFYKKELTGLLTDNLKINYGLNLKVENIDVSFFDNWPHVSVKLKNVHVTNSINPSKFGPLLKAKSISLSFNLERMVHQEFIVQFISVFNAEINLVRNADGTKNFEFKKQPHDTAKHMAINFAVNKISIQNVKFHFLNKEKDQNISIDFKDLAVRLKQYSDGLEATIKGKTVVEGLMFNAKNGEFLNNARTILDLDANYLYDSKTICIHAPSTAEIDGHPYNITSLINLGENKRLALQIESKKIKFERASALLTPKIRKVLSTFDVKRPIDAKVLIVVNLGHREEPVILAEVVGENCDLFIGNSKIPYSELFFKGKIRSLDSTGKRGDIESATITFDLVRGKVYNFPFTASIHVKNLVHSDIVVEAGLVIEANKIPFEIAKDFILKGSATANIKYSGPTNKMNSKEFLQSPMSLIASISFKNLSYKEYDRPYVYTINGKAKFNNRDLQFDDLHVKTNIAEAIVKGKAEGFVPYVFGLSKAIKATISARTELLDLNPLFVKNEPTQIDATKPAKTENKKIDPGQFEFTVNLFAKKLVCRKIEASNAKVDLFYTTNSLNIKSASLNTCDGAINAKATIKNFNDLNADFSIQNVNVKKLFDQFENFGQEAIVADNLKGNISLEAKFKTNLDDKMNLMPESMAGDVKLKLVNGHLINFEPVQKLSNFLFRNRDFNDVEFSELNESFKLRGYEMQIEELEIGSNVLNLYVMDGLYNFKGNSNINILIPWSNLKRRGKNYIPKNSGQSAENTKGVKLNFNGPSKKMKLSLGHKDQEKRF